MPVAEIIFVGLCSFLNLANDIDHMPPPSVILTADKDHTPFIAIDPTKIKVEGVTFGSNPPYAYIKLDGEELTFNDDRSVPPRVGFSLSAVASLGAYGRVANPVWNEDYVPKKMKHPKSKQVAAYAEFGNGELTADNKTTIEWEFRDSKGNKTITGKFARNVHYKFTPANGILYIEARSLDGTGKRVMKFTPINNAPLQIWIGNSMDITKDIKGYNPTSLEPGHHFKHFYKHLQGSPAVFIPYPIGIVAKGAESGYCGPDREP